MTEQVQTDDADESTETAADVAAESNRGPVVTADHVGQSFGDVTVLEDVSLSVASGSVTAVIGPNGSGKSTLLRILATINRPTDGSVTVHADTDPAIGFLPQQPAFRAGFTVADTLTFYARLVDREVDVRQTLDRVGLGEARNRKVEALSGGMTRLLGLAQAIVGDPALLVLDEPASGLDPAMGDLIFETVDEIADEGTGVVIASHELAAVERTADRVVLVDDGGIAADGSPADVVAGADADTLEDAFLSYVRGDDRSVTVRTGVVAGEGDR